MKRGKYLLRGDIGQRLDIHDQKTELRPLRKRIADQRSAQPSLASLQAGNDEWNLYGAALTRLLLAKQIIPREQLDLMPNAVDRQDGKHDAKPSGNLR